MHRNSGDDFSFGVPQDKMAASLTSFLEACLLQHSDYFARREGWKPTHTVAGTLTWTSVSTGAVTDSSGMGLPSSTSTSRYASMAS